MKSIILILILQFHLFLLSGQKEFCDCIVDKQLLFEEALTGQPFKMKMTTGSQLFMDHLFPGDIILVSGDTVRNKQISYNGYYDELILTKSGKTNMVRVDKEQVEKFILHITGDRLPITFRHLNGIITGNRKIDFYAQVLLEDTISLYATRSIELVEKVEQKASSSIIYNDWIEPAPPVYFIVFPGNKFVTIKHIGKKSLYYAFPDHKVAIRTLLNQHHQTLRKEVDMISVIQLFNKYSIF